MMKMAEQLACKVCEASYNKLTDLLTHLKVHMTEKIQNVQANIEIKAETEEPMEDEQNQNSTNIQEMIEMKLENEDIRSYICGKDVESKVNTGSLVCQETHLATSIRNLQKIICF